MNMTIDILDSILQEGARGEIESLSSKLSEPAAYSYDSTRNVFEVKYGSEVMKYYGLHGTPNCVMVYGHSHLF